MRSFKDVCPSAVFFKSIPPLDDEETDTATEDEDRESLPLPLTCLTLENSEGQDGTPGCITWETYKCTHAQILHLERITRNQSVSPVWYEHRKIRITGTKAHDVLVKRDSTDPSNLIMRIMGY